MLETRRRGSRERLIDNVVDLMKLEPPGEHPHGLSDRDFDVLFTRDTDAAHGFPANTRRSS
jgi:xylulose-5-phosphate/fructose-6-phosphate phosphoketolase